MGQLNLISSYHFWQQHQSSSLWFHVYNLHPKQCKVFISVSAKTVQNKICKQEELCKEEGKLTFYMEVKSIF